MQVKYDLVFWQNMPSLHQAPLMRALTSHLGKSVLVVATDGLSADRLAMGWEKIDYGDANLVVRPTASQLTKIVEDNRDATAHIFSGMNSYPEIRRAMKELTRGHHRHIAVITEPWDSRGLIGRLRALKFAFRGRTWDHVDTLFACGALAREQFASLGCNPEKIASFGYFVDRPPRRDIELPVGRRSVISIGTLSDRKDPRTLIQAMTMTQVGSWCLTMIGDGPLREILVEDVRRLNLSNQVKFVHRLENDKVRDALATADVLVLPSRYDGWGAVVSESLMAGTPVIVSSACGSSDLVISGSQGEVVQCGRPSEVARALDSRWRSSPVTSEARAALSNWANAIISPESAAQYLWATVTREQGTPTFSAPWHR